MIKKPTLFQSLIPIIFLIIFLVLNVRYFDDTLEGANQIILLLSAAVAAIIAISLKVKWKNIINGMVNSIGSAMPSILILLMIGALAGTWLISGVVPAMIYYGLQILNPTIFLFATVIICALVSIATGSSWSTIATIGIALMGIGITLGFNKGAIAGAIISGAYFGDKMSPLSDTTNLASAMVGTDIFTHIRYMLYTTVPSLIITLLFFLILGFSYNHGNNTTDINAVLTAIEAKFYISPLLFIVPVILIIIIIKKVPPLPALFAGTILGGIFAIIFQPDIIKQIADVHENYAISSYISIVKSMYGKVSIDSNVEIVKNLFSTNGMAGMLNTIWLIIAAMVFGGAMETAGFLKRITETLIKFAKSTGSLVAATAGACIFLNTTASDQYISIVVPGRMFAKIYKEKGYKPELLSRTLEDAGTVTAPLIPWNTGGATQSRVLGVDVISYLPYCIFNIISPIMTVLVAYLNFKIRRISDKEITDSKLPEN